jgi:cell division protein ZapA
LLATAARERGDGMAQVNVTISGKTYRMACDDGQEAHLTALGERLNKTIEMLRERFGEIGDQRLTVMAAITMADQYSETERRLRQVEAEIAGLEEARAAVVERQEHLEANVAGAIEAIAERIEGVAYRLNGAGANGGGGR